MKIPDNNSIDFEPTTIEDATQAIDQAETPAEYLKRMTELGEVFDLPKQEVKTESSWQRIINHNGDLVGTTADGTKVVFSSDHGDLLITHPDGRHETRTATVEEVEGMFGIIMSKKKTPTEIVREEEVEKQRQKDIDRLRKEADDRRREIEREADEIADKEYQESLETYKICPLCGRKTPVSYNFCGKCRGEVSSQPIISKSDLHKDNSPLGEEITPNQKGTALNEKGIFESNVNNQESSPVTGWKDITNADGILVGITSNDVRVIFTRLDNTLLLGYPDGKKETKIVSVEEVEKMFGITMSGEDSSENGILEKGQLKPDTPAYSKDFSDKQEQSDSNMEHIKKVEGINIESLNDLKEGMEIMIPVDVGIVKGRIEHLDIDNSICSITYPTTRIEQGGVLGVTRNIAEIGPKDPTFLSTLKLLNNDPKSPWFRHEIGKEVLIKRSNGSVTKAKIAFFNKDGTARVEWFENERNIGKTVSTEEIDSMNK